MKNDLTCGVVRDLLPSYVENLLGEESGVRPMTNSFSRYPPTTSSTVHTTARTIL